MGRLIRYKKPFYFRKLTSSSQNIICPTSYLLRSTEKVSCRKENLQNALERELYNVFYSM